MAYEVDIEIELTVWAKALLTAGRPAPACSNPSSPAYPDPGDGPECEITDIGIETGGPLTDEQIQALRSAIPDLDERLEEAAWRQGELDSEY